MGKPHAGRRRRNGWPGWPLGDRRHGDIGLRQGRPVPAASASAGAGRSPAAATRRTGWCASATSSKTGAAPRARRLSAQLHLRAARAECEILDTWHTVGMRGTGSHDFAARPVRARGSLFPLARRPELISPDPLYNTSIYHLWAPNIAAVALGIARAALDLFTDLAATKRPTRSSVLLAERETRAGEVRSRRRAGAFLARPFSTRRSARHGRTWCRARQCRTSSRRQSSGGVDGRRQRHRRGRTGLYVEWQHRRSTSARASSAASATCTWSSSTPWSA